MCTDEIYYGEKGLESDLRAATRKTESLKAELNEANSVWKRYNREKRRLQTVLRP
jgi:hypothetical protein